MRLLSRLVLSLLLSLGGVLSASAELPAGPQFQVNSNTPFSQIRPAIASDSMGNFVVVWQGRGRSDGDFWAILARRFAADGSSMGSEFQVETHTKATQHNPAVAMNAKGEFLVAWVSHAGAGSDSSDGSIQAQRFSASGGRVGSEFQVNTYTTDAQRYPAVAIGPAGNFLVVWTSWASDGPDTSLSSIQGQLYSADGSELGGEFQVNTETLGIQNHPATTALGDGTFVVVWATPGTAASGVQGQRFTFDGTPLGGQFRVNDFTPGIQERAAVAADGEGGFVVAWHATASPGTDNFSDSVQARRFAPGGKPKGESFQVNTTTLLDQNYPTVGVEEDGRFVVAWVSEDLDFYHFIEAQRYAAEGTPVEGEFQVNTYVTHALEPAMTMHPSGDFVVSWASDGSPGTDPSWSIQARRFWVALLADGFESGDTSAWSVTVP